MTLPSFLHFLIGGVGITVGVFLLLDTPDKLLGFLTLSIGVFNLYIVFP